MKQINKFTVSCICTKIDDLVKCLEIFKISNTFEFTEELKSELEDALTENNVFEFFHTQLGTNGFDDCCWEWMEENDYDVFPLRDEPDECEMSCGIFLQPDKYKFRIKIYDDEIIVNFRIIGLNEFELDEMNNKLIDAKFIKEDEKCYWNYRLAFTESE